MARPSKWNCPTVVIRVTEHCAEYLLQKARDLNELNEFCTKPEQPGDSPTDSRLIALDDKRTVITLPTSVWAEADRLVDEFIE